MRVHRSLREKKEVWGVGVYHGDQVGQGRAIGASFLGVNSEESEALPLVGGSTQESGRGIHSLDMGLSPARAGGWGSRWEAVQIHRV